MTVLSSVVDVRYDPYVADLLSVVDYFQCLSSCLELGHPESSRFRFSWSGYERFLASR